MSVYERLEEFVLIARPVNVISFSKRFFLDEANRVDIKTAHMLHLLPYVIFDRHKLESVTLAIFEAMSPKISDWISATVFIDIVKLSSSDAFPHDEFIIDLISRLAEKVGRIDFTTFLSLARLYFSCSYIMTWTRCVHAAIQDRPHHNRAEMLRDYLNRPTRDRMRTAALILCKDVNPSLAARGCVAWTARDDDCWAAILERLLQEKRAVQDIDCESLGHNVISLFFEDVSSSVS